MYLLIESLHFATLLIFATLSYLLYLRWNSHGYRSVTAAAGITAFITLLYILVLEFSTVANLINGMLALTILFSSLLCAGVFHFLQTKRKKEFIHLLMIAGGVSLIGGVSLLFNHVFMVPVLGIVFTVLYVWRYVPLMPRKKYFYVAMGANLISHITLGINIAFNNPFISYLTVISNLIFSFVMLLIFFSRIADLIQAASHQSITDGLTKLYYKTFFKSKVQAAMREAARPAVIFADIDDFKKLNDTEGHLIGDQILRLVGEIWNDICSHDIGIAARYGGEETVALITSPQVDPRSIAERFRSRVEEESKAIRPVTVSVGLAFFKNDVETAELFIKQADDAMYAAKSAGKNRVLEYGSLPKPTGEALDQESPNSLHKDNPVEEVISQKETTSSTEIQEKRESIIFVSESSPPKPEVDYSDANSDASEINLSTQDIGPSEDNQSPATPESVASSQEGAAPIRKLSFLKEVFTEKKEG